MFQPFIEYFRQEPIIIQIVWLSSCLLFLIIIVLITSLKLLRTHLRRNEHFVEKNTKKYELLLITYLYLEKEEGVIGKEEQTVVDEIKSILNDEFIRNIIVATMLRLKNEITGELADSIQDLYYQTKLNKYALKKITNKNWYTVAEGIRELNLFLARDAHDEIVKHINHPKREVRKEVQLYLVKLFNFKGLVFLDKLKTSLSEWDQIQLLEELQRFDNQEIPDISPWLKSKNVYVVYFAIKLAKIYHQFEVKDVLLELLSHKDKEVKVQVIRVMSHLQVLESKEIIKRDFGKLSKEEQVAFFELLENLFEMSDLPFLKKQVRHENFDIKYIALKMLNMFDNAAFEKLEMSPPDPEFEKIVEFIKNT